MRTKPQRPGTHKKLLRCGFGHAPLRPHASIDGSPTMDGPIALCEPAQALPCTAQRFVEICSCPRRTHRCFISCLHDMFIARGAAA
jgi:hypothetical protein